MVGAAQDLEGAVERSPPRGAHCDLNIKKIGNKIIQRVERSPPRGAHCDVAAPIFSGSPVTRGKEPPEGAHCDSKQGPRSCENCLAGGKEPPEGGSLRLYFGLCETATTYLVERSPPRGAHCDNTAVPGPPLNCCGKEPPEGGLVAASARGTRVSSLSAGPWPRAPSAQTGPLPRPPSAPLLPHPLTAPLARP